MSTTRRQFLRASVAASAAASLPWRAFAMDDSPSSKVVANAGVKVVHEAAVLVDTTKRQIKTTDGTYDYDR